MPLIEAPLGGAHVPSGDDANESPRSHCEHDHEQPTSFRRPEHRMVAAFGPAEPRRNGEDFLGLLRLDAMAQGEMKHIPRVPLEFRDAHVREALGNTLDHQRRPSKSAVQMGS